MSDETKHRLVAYIQTYEQTICGEWCDATWPDCEDERHDEGRALLSLLTVDAP